MIYQSLIPNFLIYFLFFFQVFLILLAIMEIAFSSRQTP